MSTVNQLGKYQPYPDYKDSGVEWLGDVPFNWTVTKVKRFASFTTGWTPPTGNELFFGGEHLWANISDIGEKFLSSTSKTITDAGIRATKIKKSPKGSLLFSFKLSIGQVSIVSEDMYTNEAIATFLPSESLNVPYMYWAAPLFIPRNAEENIYGAKLLNQERISNADFVLPSTDEQRTIAAFLDYETARIDQLIAKQQQLIELLKEKRQAVISHAVTKGLNPNAPMKDSGVEWLGQVPKHWVVTKSSYIFSQPPKNGISPPVTESNNGVPTFSISAIRNGKVNIIDNLKMTDLDVVVARKFAVHVGDAMVVRGNGNLSMVGAVGIVSGVVPVMCVYPDILIKVKINESIIKTCFFVSSWSSKSSRNQIENMANTTNGTYKINGEHMRSVYLAIPPLTEQAQITAYVDRVSCEIERLVAVSESAVELLRERRTALISAAVTGKIDLRGWQPPKSEEAA